MTAGAVTRPRSLNPGVIEVLDTMAMREKPGSDVPFMAGVLACPDFTPQEMQAAWEAMQEAVIWLHALDGNERPWFEYTSESALAPGLSKQNAAVDLAGQVADEARHHFVFGGPR